MKLKTLLVSAVALLCSAASWAYQTPEANGVYYIQNVKTGKFVNYGWNYGARFRVDDYGTAWKLISDGDNFKIQAIAASDRNFQDDTWMYADGGGDRIRSYSIASVAGQSGVYTMTNTKNSMKVYVYMNDEGDKYFIAGNAIKGENYTDDDQTYWRFLSQAERDAYVAGLVHENETAVLAEYGLELPADVSLSSYLESSTYFKSEDVTVNQMNTWTWTVISADGTASDYNTSVLEVFQGEGTADNKQKVGGTLSTTMTGLSAGLYKITLPAMYRFGSNANCYANEKTNGYKGLNGGGYFSAGGNPVPLATWASACASNSNPNSPSEFNTIVGNGGYKNVTFAHVTGSSLDLIVCVPGSIVKGWFVTAQATAKRYNLKSLSEASDFTNGTAVNANEWFKYTIENAGLYQIESAAAATVKYSQDGDLIVTSEIDNTLTFATNGKKIISLAGGTLYFHSDARSEITITRISDGFDLTGYITNAAVASTTGWTDGGTASGQQYTGAPDNTYLDNNSGTKNMYQDVNLPAGYYLLKCATRASTNANANVYVYSYKTGTNVGQTDNHKEGNSGNLLEGGWAWTYVPFTLEEAGNVGIGFWSNCSSTWAGADDFHLTYYSTELAMKQGHLAQVVADANAWADKVTTNTALETALAASAPTCSTIEECNTAISNLITTIASARASETAYAEFVSLKSDADAIKEVAYTETASGSHSTYISAISTQNTAAEAATTAEGITTAASALKTAIKIYINGAEPLNEGEYFDITCLIGNPSFDKNNATGWSGTTPNAVSFGCAEFFNMNFDFYQNLTGLANGSYQLTVQAYCRPGDNGNTTAGAYYDYTQGVNNITAELYVNSDASTIGNIYSYKDNTTAAKVDGNDFHCNISPDDYWVPNNMQGASLYFKDDAYVTNVAALVEDGNLRIGFRETNKKTHQWVIFDDFHLYYYGTSKMIYYKQYLPQLEADISANYLNNGAYDVLKTGQTERAALEIANGADAEDLDTEEDLQNAIDAINDAKDGFVAAKNAYENLNTAKSSYHYNVGDGVFQMSSSQKATFDATISAANSIYSTGTASKSDVETAIDNIAAAYVLNAPEASKRYNVSIVDGEQAWNGNAVTFIAGGRGDMGGYAIQYLAPANAYMNQALKFTAVAGEANTYKVSAINVEDGGERYITTGSIYDGNNTQIRTTDEASSALQIKISATTTDGQFQLINTADNNRAICRNSANPDNGMYTDGNVSFTISEASQAEVTVSCKAGKYGTVILPFTPDVSSGFDGITFYGCNDVNNETNNLLLTEIDSPAANTPYIIKNTNRSENFTKVLSGWGTAKQDSYNTGLLTGVYTAARISASASNYVLQTHDDGVQAFYSVDADFTATPYKAYLTHSGGSVKAFGFDIFDAINAIEAAQNEKTEIYNLAGQRLSKAQKGVNIINGKKVLVK